ncbi:MAG: hypothetical protein ACTHOG_06845 [Marmoricola sp.]
MTPQSNGQARRTPPRRPAPRRLPAAVYWRRRAVVFGTPVIVLIAIIAMFSGGGSQPQRASLAGNTTTPHVATTPTQVATTASTGQPVNANAMPSGPCPASSIQATPSVSDGIAGGPIQVDIALATTQTACNFTMSGSNVAIKIMSSARSLWTSQDCPNVIPTGTLILRNAAPVDVSLSWDGHQSSGSCGATNAWVGPGSYSVIASVIGSTPTTGNFSLRLPTAKTVTKTATPTPHATPTAKATAKATTRSGKAENAATSKCGDSCKP